MVTIRIIITLTTTWQKYVVFLDVPTLSGGTFSGRTWFGINFWFNAGPGRAERASLIGLQSGTFDLAMVQAYISSTVLDCKRRSWKDELDLCRAYFQKTYSKDTAVGSVTFTGAVKIKNEADYARIAQPVSVQFCPTMIHTPTVKLYSANTGAIDQVYNSSIPGDVSGCTADYVNENGISQFSIQSFDPDTAVYFHYTAVAELGPWTF